MIQDLSFHPFTSITLSTGYVFVNIVSEYMLSDGLMCSFMGGLVSSSEKEPDS